MESSVRSVLVVHAHPDDETLATGGAIAELADLGVTVSVLTATRGEQGEVVPGSVDPGADLTLHRARELAAACQALGVTYRAFLGESVARAAGLTPRRYTDSGMRWLDEAETLAGPGDSAGPDALTAASASEITADIAAYAAAVAADILITYDIFGGYGHPDHVALHVPTRDAAAQRGVPFWEIASHPDADGQTMGEGRRAQVMAALECYASQLTVDGDDVVHVGGQRQPITITAVLRSGQVSS